MGRFPAAARAIGVLGVLGVLLVACSEAAEPAPTQTPTPRLAEQYAAELVSLTNQARTAEGLEELTDSACAREAARERAGALVGQDELVHAPLAPVIQACAPLTTAAENLVNSPAEPADVVDAWLRSPGHRANIVDPALTEIGVDCVPDEDSLLCAQIFLGP